MIRHCLCVVSYGLTTAVWVLTATSRVLFQTNEMRKYDRLQTCNKCVLSVCCFVLFPRKCAGRRLRGRKSLRSCRALFMLSIHTKIALLYVAHLFNKYRLRVPLRCAPFPVSVSVIPRNSHFAQNTQISLRVHVPRHSAGAIQSVACVHALQCNSQPFD